MEKFQIARYGLMQLGALFYGILACGTATKLAKPLVEDGYQMPYVYWGALFYRDYGIFFFMAVIGWVLAVGYYSAPGSRRQIDSIWLTWSGMILFLGFLILGSILAFGTGSAATVTHGPIRPL